MPFGQSGRAILLEDVAGDEVAVEIEIAMDRGVDGGEFLKGLDVPEFRLRSFVSAKWLMQVFRPVV